MKNGDEKREEEFTAMYLLFDRNAEQLGQRRTPSANISSFLQVRPWN
ncbi:MAG: hypothetical protein AB8G77_05875 [Rhodothermales bacterium]